MTLQHELEHRDTLSINQNLILIFLIVKNLDYQRKLLYLQIKKPSLKSLGNGFWIMRKKIKVLSQ